MCMLAENWIKPHVSLGKHRCPVIRGVSHLLLLSSTSYSISSTSLLYLYYA